MGQFDHLMPKEPKTGPEADSVLERFSTGFGRGITNVGEGAKGLAYDIGNKLGLVDDVTVSDFNSKVQEGRDFYAVKGVRPL